VVAQPALEPIDAKMRSASPHVHRAVDPRHVSEFDARGLGTRLCAKPFPRIDHPVAETTSKTRTQSSRAAEERRHDKSTVALREGKVVDLGHWPPVRVDDLPIQQVKSGVVSTSGRVRICCLGHHCPAFVMIINGIAATEATITITR
jgi:hypothetical protein